MSAELLLSNAQYTRLGHQLQNSTVNTLIAGTGIFTNLIGPSIISSSGSFSTLTVGTAIIIDCQAASGTFTTLISASSNLGPSTITSVNTNVLTAGTSIINTLIAGSATISQVNSDLTPDANGTRSLGLPSRYYQNAYIENAYVTNLTTASSLDTSDPIVNFGSSNLTDNINEGIVLVTATGVFSGLMRSGSQSVKDYYLFQNQTSQPMVGDAIQNFERANLHLATLEASTGLINNLVAGTGSFINMSSGTGTFFRMTASSGTFVRVNVNGTLTAGTGNFANVDSSNAGGILFNGNMMLSNKGTTNLLVGVTANTSVVASGGDTMVGYNAGKLVSNGTNNTLLGAFTGNAITTGAGNTLLGSNAGINYTSSESNNIIIGNQIYGNLGENNTIRMGTGMTSTLISGIRGISSSTVDAKLVGVSSDGQLCTDNIQSGLVTNLTSGTGVFVNINSTTNNLSVINAGTATLISLTSGTGVFTTLNSTTNNLSTINAGTCTLISLTSGSGLFTTLNSTINNLSVINCGTASFISITAGTSIVSSISAPNITAGTGSFISLTAGTGSFSTGLFDRVLVGTLLQVNGGGGVYLQNGTVTGDIVTADNGNILLQNRSVVSQTGIFYNMIASTASVSTLIVSATALFTNTRTATSASNASVVFSGGVGIGDNLSLGQGLTCRNTLSLKFDSANMSVGNTTPISIAFTDTLAINTTYTVPNCNANASFIMSETAQTINGAKTFTATTTSPTFNAGTGIYIRLTSSTGIFNGGTNSTSSTSGTVIVTGGQGISQNLYVAGTGVFSVPVVSNAGVQTQYAIATAGPAVSCLNATDTLLTWTTPTLVGITYSAGTFTCPKAGLYLCTATYKWGALNPGICYGYFYKNASTSVQYGASNLPNTTFNWTTTATIQCAANDTIGFYVNQQNTGGTQNVTGVCIGITLISAI